MEVREETVEPVQPGQMLVHTRLSAISPGTELLFYRGQVPEDLVLDGTIASLSGAAAFPFKYGYSVVGEVVEAFFVFTECRIGLLDIPTARKKHQGHVPMVGAGLFVAIAVSALLLDQRPSGFASFMMGLAALVVLGVFDDRLNLRAHGHREQTDHKPTERGKRKRGVGIVP